jgi:hypothetical protein
MLDFKKVILLIYLVLFTFCHSLAQKIYESNWGQESTIFGASAGLYLGGYLFEQSRDPISIEGLDLLNKNDINSFDRGTVGNFSDRAAGDSDYFKNGLIVVPFTLLFSKQGRENFGQIFLMYTEVIALNGSITQFSKASVGRYRPYAYNPDAPLDVKFKKTTRRSFFSGHVSHVASLSFFTASIYCDLYPDSKFKTLVWAGAITAPAITAYLRVRAGRHFPTDVIVGYGVGALVGYFIPKLHKKGIMSDVSIVGAENGAGIVYHF